MRISVPKKREGVRINITEGKIKRQLESGMQGKWLDKQCDRG